MGMRWPPDSAFRAVPPVAGAVLTLAALAAIHMGGTGRWLPPAGAGEDALAWCRIPPAAEAGFTVAWCVAGGLLGWTTAAAVARLAGAAGLGVPGAALVGAVLTINGPAFRAMLVTPAVGAGGAAGLAALAFLVRVIRRPAPRTARRRRPPSARRIAAVRLAGGLAVALGWTCAGLPSLVTEVRRIAAAAPRVTGAPPPQDEAEPDPAPPRIPGWRVVDLLNPGDRESEASHAYRISADAAPAPEGLIDSTARRIVRDGGRMTAGREVFTLSTQRERAFVLLARCAAPGGGRLRVRWNDSPMRVVRLVADPTHFQTVIIAEDRGQLAGSSNRIEIAREDGAGIGTYCFWVLQPR